MPQDDHIARAIRKAHDAYELARRELGDALSELDPDEFDQTLSRAEEFGARHVRSQMEGEAEKRVRLASTQWYDELEQKLQRYIDANAELDHIVADVEERRHLEGDTLDKRTMAFHGEFPVVDMVNMTITFPGRPPEVLVLQEGTGPESPQPERGLTRTRRRGRSR
jgi:hypothetical protein